MAEEKQEWTVKCPECGKERTTNRPPTRQRQGTFEGDLSHFCSLRCETNYKYRQKKRNIWTGNTGSSEDASKWQH